MSFFFAQLARSAGVQVASLASFTGTATHESPGLAVGASDFTEADNTLEPQPTGGPSALSLAASRPVSPAANSVLAEPAPPVPADCAKPPVTAAEPRAPTLATAAKDTSKGTIPVSPPHTFARAESTTQSPPRAAESSPVFFHRESHDSIPRFGRAIKPSEMLREVMEWIADEKPAQSLVPQTPHANDPGKTTVSVEPLAVRIPEPSAGATTEPESRDSRTTLTAQAKIEHVELFTAQRLAENKPPEKLSEQSVSVAIGTIHVTIESPASPRPAPVAIQNRLPLRKPDPEPVFSPRRYCIYPD
jgi:hypothetical protein